MINHLLYCSLEQSIFFIVLSLLMIITFIVLMFLDYRQFKNQLKHEQLQTIIKGGKTWNY